MRLRVLRKRPSARQRREAWEDEGRRQRLGRASIASTRPRGPDMEVPRTFGCVLAATPSGGRGRALLTRMTEL